MSKSFEPEIVVLYCRQAVNDNADFKSALNAARGFEPRVIVMPCSSKAEVPHLMRILERGADGVIVVACPENTCQFMVGNVRAEKRVAYAADLLRQVGMGEERVAIVRGRGLAAEEVLALAEQRADAVRKLGPNPLKGDS